MGAPLERPRDPLGAPDRAQDVLPLEVPEVDLGEPREPAGLCGAAEVDLVTREALARAARGESTQPILPPPAPAPLAREGIWPHPDRGLRFRA